MPHKKSAIKALRKSRKLYARHSVTRKKIKDLRKKISRAAASGDVNVARASFKQLQKVLDKAAKAQGFLKKNTVARYKSRAMKKINSAAPK